MIVNDGGVVVSAVQRGRRMPERVIVVGQGRAGQGPFRSRVKEEEEEEASDAL